MQVRLTSDQLGPNPNFNYRLPADPDTNPLNVTVPEGTVIDHPEAIYLVINEQAEPIDEEAKAAYARHLERKEKTLQNRRPVINSPSTPAPAPSVVETVVSPQPVQPADSTPAAQGTPHPAVNPEPVRPAIATPAVQSAPVPAPSNPVPASTPVVPAQSVPATAAPQPALQPEAAPTPLTAEQIRKAA